MLKKNVLTSIDVAWILNYSPDDVISLARKGELLGTKVGKSWRFRRSDVTAYQKKMGLTQGAHRVNIR